MDDRDVTFKTIVLLLINKHSQDKLYFKEETKQKNKNKNKKANVLYALRIHYFQRCIGDETV